ncbi:zinc-dependent metalloprotease, partial [bacterium]|nr:zinc-dependent metalloprotease [bacterium]
MNAPIRLIARFVATLLILCLLAPSAHAATRIWALDSVGKVDDRPAWTLSGALFQDLRDEREVVFERFPLSETENVDLRLERFEVFDENTQFVEGTASGDRVVAAPEVFLYRGAVQGDPQSTVFLGISREGTNGYVAVGDKTYLISAGGERLRGATSPLVFVTDAARIETSSDTPFCGVADDPAHPAPSRRRMGRSQVSATPIVKAALDGTFRYFQTMGSALNAAHSYHVELLGAASMIYERDFGVKLWLSYSRVWSSEDPFLDNGDTAAELSDFRSYWNENMDGIDRHFASRISSVPGGGIAWVDVLCDPSMAYS